MIGEGAFVSSESSPRSKIMADFVILQLLIFATLFYFVFPEEEDLRTAFTQLEEQLERMIKEQEQHYRKTYKRAEEALNGSLPTVDQSSMNHSSLNSMYDRLAESDEPINLDKLNDAMTKLRMRAFDMMKNHAQIMAREVSITEKVKGYEENVNRVIKELKENEQDKVEKLIKKKDRIVAAKGTLNDTSIHQKISNLAKSTLLRKNDANHTSLNRAVSRLEARVEHMMQTQADVLESQTSFEKVLDNVDEQLHKAYEKILGKKKDGLPTVSSTGGTTEKTAGVDPSKKIST